MLVKLHLLFALALSTVLACCQKNNNNGNEIILNKPEQLNDGLVIGSFSENALDSIKLQDLVKKIKANEYRNINSIVIFSNDHLVLEEYFNGASINQLHTMQSVTKSVTSLLVGKAVDEHLIQSIDSPVIKHFPEYPILNNMDDRKSRISIKNLLMMQTGIDWNENPYAGSNLETLNNSSGDWVKYVLDRPMAMQPGVIWQYNSGGCIALSGLIKNATHQNTDIFASQSLFGPLGITSSSWFYSPFNGIPHTGGGLSLRSRDMLKIGVMVLNKGKWQGQQIISESWINESTKRSCVTPGNYSYPAYYGYYWWIYPYNRNLNDDPADDIITARGARGQWLFIIPKKKTVIAVTANTDDELTPLTFLCNGIIPAFQ